MKLDTKAMRYLTAEDWRVLAGVEQGSKNHEVVPTPLITQLSGLRGGSGVHRCISNLAKVNLIARVPNAKYDGYRLTYGGLDYLALHTHQKRSSVYSVGNQIGVGKESDIFVVASSTGTQHVLKIHRLGRISFRTVKANRDYLRQKTRNPNASGSGWMYMSKLAAMKEYAFMKTLHANGFPVPEPLAQSRHTIVMQLIDAFPLRQITDVPDPAALYAELIAMILRFASVGLIHGDFNEFNILIREDTTTDGDKKRKVLTPIVIDFPQTLSVDHPNAEMYFDRDVACIKRFFQRRYHFTSSETGPTFADARRQLLEEPYLSTVGYGVEGQPSKRRKRLDVEVEATGFSRKMARELDRYMKDVGVDGDGPKLDADADADGGTGQAEQGRSGDEDEMEYDEGGDGDGEMKVQEDELEEYDEDDENMVRDKLGNWVRRPVVDQLPVFAIPSNETAR